MNQCTKMNREELLNAMKTFSVAYDIVRVVEPESTTVLCLDQDGYHEKQFEPCFSVWEKEERCENCISLKTCMEQRRMSKFEFRNEKAYSVLSIPILLCDVHKERLVALELVNKVTDQTLFQAHGTGEIAEEVKKLNQKIYEDSLTGVYNRRYYDENLHVYDMAFSVPKRIGYLVIDVNRFKYVNDHFGHASGDELLIAVAEALQKNVRESDRLMRIGGDEFLLVIRDCSKLFIEKKVLQLKKAVSEISLKGMEGYKPSVSIGMSYTTAFDGTRECLDAMFKEADVQMYQNKSMPMPERKRMLIVDDLEINRAVLKNYFHEEFEILEAPDGMEALRVLKTHIVEVVVTDIYMPGMDGLTLTREIRKDPEISNVIIFVITEGGEQYEIASLEAGADDFINKPFNPELLRHRMKGVLVQNTVFNRISQYQLSFNQNQIAFATVRLENKKIVFQYVNEAFSQLLSGRPQEFLSGKKKLDFEGFEAFLNDVTTTHKRNRITVYDQTLDQYFDIVAYAQDNGFCSFIVLKNEAMKVIEINEMRYQDEFANLAAADPNTFGALFVNLKQGICEKAVGRSPYLSHFTFPLPYEEVIEELLKFVVAKHARQRFLAITDQQKLVDAYQSGVYNLREEIPFYLVNGAMHWLGVYVKLVENPETKEPQAILYCSDIHKQKISQFVIDTISKRNFDTMFVMDIHAGTAQVYMGAGSDYWSDPIPVPKMDQAIGEYLRVHYQEPDKEQFLKENVIPAIVEKMQDRESYSVKYPIIEEDGSWHLKKGIYTWLDETRNLLCFTREDITDIIQKEQENSQKLQKVNEELIHASNAKVEFLSRMSHDIRTPMNTILGLSALALDDVKEPEKMTKYIEDINAAGKFLLGLVNDILDMDKINRGQMTLNLEPYRYDEFAKGIKLMFESACAQKHITFRFAPACKTITVLTDRIRLNQIFFNVLSNAIKYTPEGGCVSFWTEQLQVEEKRVSCDYIIQDTGIGMTEAFQKKMFEEFSQEGKNTEISSQGSGLGLAITKSLVDLMGGTIQIDSAVGKGTTVRIHLSFERTEQELQTLTESDRTKREESLYGLEVLLAEDHPLNQEIARKLLEKKGMTVHCANNGDEAVQLFEKSKPGYFKVILMDIRMPVLNGIEATKVIRGLERQDAASVPIIAMTANAYTEDVALTREAGMNGHLAKPVNPQFLYETIGEFALPKTQQ